VRAVACIIVFFVLVALVWALQPQLAAYAAVRALGDSRLDAHVLEVQLRHAGHAARPALRRGLASDNLRRRAFCARLLALNGDNEGDLCLLRMLRYPAGTDTQSPNGRLRGHDPISGRLEIGIVSPEGSGAPVSVPSGAVDPLSVDSAAAMAGTFILSVWMERDAPPLSVRVRVLASNNANALASLLERYHAWSGGHVALARIGLKSGEAAEARYYALQALAAEPENFEAMVVLAQAYLGLNQPGQAMLCLEQAVGLNPRLKPALASEIREALKGLDLERARKRKEQRKREPIACILDFGFSIFDCIGLEVQIENRKSKIENPGPPCRGRAARTAPCPRPGLAHPG
jgi:tetratricopeptide (TPR) repeat protein